jgi:Antirestriction protein
LLTKYIIRGELPWQKSWDGKIGTSIASRPQNAITGEPYHKANAIYLAMIAKRFGEGKDPRFCTFAAAKEQGWYVRKGEHGFSIVRGFWAEKDRNGMPLPKEEQHWTKTYSTVFHASQFYRIKDGEKIPLPDYESKTTGYSHTEKIQMAESILEKSQAKIFNDQGDRAFYAPSKDEIHLPPREAFSKLENYYAVALHELGHWTGHENRLKRDMSGRFGTKSYAKEELRAEMASVYLSMETGIPFDPTNHAAYTQSWLSALKNDKNEFFKAAKDAEVIAGYVLDLAREQDKSKETIDVEIYQANSDCPWKFRSILEGAELDFDSYSLAWKGTLEKQSLDEIYMKFNMEDRPSNFTGHSLSVSDIVSVNGNYHYCDSFGFKALEYNQEKNLMSEHQVSKPMALLGKCYKEAFLEKFAEGFTEKTIDEDFIKNALLEGSSSFRIKKILNKYSPLAAGNENYTNQIFREMCTPEIKKAVQEKQVLEKCL